MLRRLLVAVLAVAALSAACGGAPAHPGTGTPGASHAFGPWGLSNPGSINVYVGSTPPTGCIFPTCFPDASNTGTSGTLTTVNSDVTLSTPGQTYSAKRVIGCITVTAANVTISNVLVECPGAGIGILALDDGSSGSPLTVVDSEIDCTGAEGQNGIAEADVTVIRTEIRNCENGLDVNRDITVQDSWLHLLDDGGADPHEDGAQLASHFEGGTLVNGAKNVTFEHNTIEGKTKTGGNSTSAIIMNKLGTTPDQNVLVQHNLLSGGAITVYCDRNDASPHTVAGTNVRVINNRFVGDFASGGGDSTDCSDETSAAGNVRHSTGLSITLD
jgi:hypothetical protein